MNARFLTEMGWDHVQAPACLDRMKDVEDILKRLADSFTEVNIAADFLHLRADPGSGRPELQLTCLIKERIAAIQEQITELYYTLSTGPSPYPLLKQ